MTREEIIRSGIKPGLYTRTELKAFLEALYEFHGIHANAKATDVSLVYRTRPTTIRRYRRKANTTVARVIACLILEE